VLSLEDKQTAMANKSRKQAHNHSAKVKTAGLDQLSLLAVPVEVSVQHLPGVETGSLGDSYQQTADQFLDQ
jgi:hypothetical protein